MHMTAFRKTRHTNLYFINYVYSNKNVLERVVYLFNVLVLVLLITGEGNQVCYPIKYRINLINIIHNVVPIVI